MARKAPIRVPSRAVDVLSRFAALSDEEAQSLSATLDDNRFLSTKQLTDRATEFLPSLSSEDVDQLISTLLTLVHAQREHGWLLEDTTQAVSDDRQLDLDDEGRRRFRRHLLAVLSTRGFEALAKAVDIAAASEKVLHTARVITDVRPIFEGDEPAPVPVGAVVLQTLALNYVRDRELRDISISCSTDDLRRLRSTIDRAIAKASSMEEFLFKAGLLTYDVSQEED
jgi:hypothetical protein